MKRKMVKMSLVALLAGCALCTHGMWAAAGFQGEREGLEVPVEDVFLEEEIIGPAWVTAHPRIRKGIAGMSLGGVRVHIGAGVKKICPCTFTGYLCLTDVQFAEGSTLEEIGCLAFSQTAITSIKIPQSVERVGSDVFTDCTELATVVFEGARVKKIEHNTFGQCRALQRFEIPLGIEVIGDNAFVGCSALEHVEIPGSVQKIENCAFANCSALKGIEIPGSVQKIETCAFINCSALKNIKIPASVKELEEAALGRSGLDSIHFESAAILGGATGESAILNFLDYVIRQPGERKKCISVKISAKTINLDVTWFARLQRHNMRTP
jgi:hypothetical protein